jgi:two-component system, LytTR family, sensor kinase
MEGNGKQSERATFNWRNPALGFVVWTIIGLSFASRTYFSYYQNGTPVRWEEVYSGFLIDFYVWAIVSPLIFKLARKFPVERGERLWSHLLFHIPVSLVLTFAVNAVSLPATWYFGFPNLTRHPTLAILFNDYISSSGMLHQGLLVYWGTLITAQAFEYYRQIQAGKTRAVQLSQQLAAAQLAALKMQIHPHFLFNTLNSIAALLHKDVEAADRMIARLSDFLRLTLQSSETNHVTLEQELEFTKAYLDIEKIRFQERLVVEMRILPEALDARVPNLILQPLIENAVRHGIARQTVTGILRIQARREAERLLVKIEDNGPGLNGNNKRKTENGNGGVGLANTRARLEQFYGDDFRFEIERNSDATGTTVNLNLPFGY